MQVHWNLLNENSPSNMKVLSGKLVLEMFKYLSWTYYIYYFKTNETLESKSVMINTADIKLDCTVNMQFYLMTGLT